MRSIDVIFSSASGYSAVVKLCGEHDLATSSDVEAALAPLSGSVLVDATACDFIDSTVIGVLLRKSQELRREGQRLELSYQAGSHVSRVMEIIDIAQLMTVHVRSQLLAADGPPAVTEGLATPEGRQPDVSD